MERWFKFCGLFLLVFLLGCGGAPEAESVVIVSETAVSRTIQHTFGTDEIPKEPLRVVTLGEESMLVNLLDIGIQPVLSIVNIPDDVPLITAEEAGGTQLVSSSGNVSMEALVAVDPDLIIGNVFFINKIGYSRLSDIAPTVSVSYETPLIEYVETLAVFGLREQAEADVAEFEAQIAAEAARINAADIELSVAAMYGGSNLALFFDGPQPPPEMVKKLGVTILPDDEEREPLKIRNGRSFVNEERLDLISDERLIMLQTASVDGEMESYNELTSSALWQQLPVVKNGTITVLDRIGYPGFRGQQALLTDLVAALE